MRRAFLIPILFITASLSAQGSGKYFSGALELGSGWGIPIDFRTDNNLFTTEDLAYRLLYRPWKAGLHIQRELNTRSFVEYGMEFRRRQSTWTESYSQSVRYMGTYSYRSLNPSSNMDRYIEVPADCHSQEKA